MLIWSSLTLRKSPVFSASLPSVSTDSSLKEPFLFTALVAKSYSRNVTYWNTWNARRASRTDQILMVRKIKASWWVDFQIRRKRYRYRSPDNSKMGAEAFEAVLRHKLGQGEDIRVVTRGVKPESESPLLFREFVERWFQTYVMTNNKASTRRSKRNTIDLHLIPYFGKKTLAEITVLGIEEFKASKLKAGLSPKTINNLLSILRKSLMCAEEWELLIKVPRIKWLRVPPSPYRFLSIEQSRQLLAGAENVFWYAMILCALRTGMRIGEMCALDWSDINWERRTITVRRSIGDGVVDSPKSNRIRTIPMTDDLYELFFNRKLLSGLIFAGPDGKHIRGSSWPWKALTRACKRAGLPMIGWHALRHTFASELTAQSVPMKATQMLLGHASIQMTERYAHLAPSTLSDAVALLPRSSARETSEFEKNVNHVSTVWQR